MDKELWYGKSTVFQMLNAWHEVRRAIRLKNEGRGSNIRGCIKVATDLLRLAVSDPKNKDRIKEIEFYIEIIEDYFWGENKYNTTDEVLLNYFDTYMEMYYDELEREDENDNVE